MWFITINQRHGRMLFGEVMDSQMRLNAFGRIVQQCWLEIPSHFLHVAPDEFIVMPNHVHVLLHLWTDAPEPGQIEAFSKPVKGSVATIIRSFKGEATYRIRQHAGRRIDVWQPRFYDSRILDPDGVARVRQYIRDNPRQWQEKSRNRGRP